MNVDQLGSGSIIGAVCVILGILIKAGVDLLRDRNKHKTDGKVVQVTETEAETKQFDTLFTHFNELVQRAEAAASRAEREREAAQAAQAAAEKSRTDAEAQRDEVMVRLGRLEREREDMFRYMQVVEDTMPTPPGAPPRPAWAQHRQK